jgi:hypothetical protein
MWRVYRFERAQGSRRPWRPVYATDNAALARERFAREWAALRRGHVLLTCDGKVIRHARAARLRVVRLRLDGTD